MLLRNKYFKNEIFRSTDDMKSICREDDMEGINIFVADYFEFHHQFMMTSQFFFGFLSIIIYPQLHINLRKKISEENFSKVSIVFKIFSLIRERLLVKKLAKLK